jgi:hypothetical protein
MENSSCMRDRMLHDSLRTLTEDASLLLEDLLAAGAEIPFEVGESGSLDHSPGMRGSVTMFAYRPLTAEFVSTHADRIRQLPAFENAAQNLARTRGVIAYLRVREEPVLDVGELTHARLGVLGFLGAVWQDAERFEHWGDRFDRAYSELEAVALAERLVTTVVIPIHGVALLGGSINLGSGVELLATEELDPSCADRFSDSAAAADSYCSISVTAPSDAPTPMPEVRLAARSLLTALRLFRPGSIALGATAQAEVAGAWHQVSMPFSGRSREDAWNLREGDEEELRQFVGAVRRVERRTRIAWALKRFETGLECTVPADGLTDFMLALRALLEAEGDHGKAALPVRVSALCAQSDERELVRGEIEAAFALERLAINGSVGRADRKRLAKLAPLDVIAAAERHLRALLHDLVCGYLSTDLKALADEILEADGHEPVAELPASDPVHLEPVPSPGEPAPVDPTATVEFDAVFDDTAEITALDMRADLKALADDQPGLAEDEQPEDNVWSLRPAQEIAPAPPVADEPVMVEETPPTTASPALAPLQLPEWESAPERRPTDDRTAPASDPAAAVGSPGPDGFTFDFQTVPLPAAPAPSTAPVAESTEDSSAPAFPIPEFALPTDRGPVATQSDAVVDAAAQGEALSEIMNADFQHPPRRTDELGVTPLARERNHLAPITAADLAAPPRIVRPDAAPPPLLPLDPELTIEYDVLGSETSAEESAQLAWSEQFLRRTTASSVPVEAAPETPAEAPAVMPAEPGQQLRPVPDLVVAKFPQPVEQVAPEEQGAQGDRTQRIGPSTVEFRPVVDADPDDPDDFCGGV